MLISLFPKISQTTGGADIDIKFFLDYIKEGKWEIEAGLVRQGKADKKEDIPYVTMSGQFKDKRSNSTLTQHSGFIAIDVDKMDPQHVKNLLNHDRYLYAAFASISGKGICLLFRIDGNKHLESFLWIEEYLHDKYGIICDTSCKDVSRPRFVSYDPDLIFNPNVPKTPAKKKEQVKKYESVIFVESDFDAIIAQAQARNINLCDAYHDWLRVGFALVDKFGAEGRQYFHALSQMSDKYTPDKCDRQYDNCMRAGKQGVTIATLYHFAKQNHIEIYSEQTRKVAQVAIQAKKQHRDRDSAISTLAKYENIPQEVSAPIINQVFEQGITIASEESPMDEMESWIKHNYQLKKNLISRKIYNNGKFFEPSSINSMYVALKKIMDKGVSSEMIEKFINSDEVESYNPIHEFVIEHKDVTADGVIDDYINCFTTTRPDYFRKFFFKWYVSVIRSAYGHISSLMMVFTGPQNTGKTRAFRELLPAELREYYADSKLDAGKDDEILMTQKLLIMDDEMGGKSKKETNRLKDLTSKEKFSLREPYGRANVDLTRLAVLCGTTNDPEVLNDPTGNRRIIPVTVTAIDFEAINQIDRTAMFIEAYNLYKDGFETDLTNSEILELNVDVEEYRDYSQEYGMIMKFYRKPKMTERADELSVTEILLEMQARGGNHISKKRLSMELKSLNFEQVIAKEFDASIRKWRVVRLSEVYVPGSVGSGGAIMGSVFEESPF